MNPRDLELSTAALKPLLAQKAVRLLDVREGFEVAGGIIEGAVHIPLGQLPTQHQTLETDLPIVVYCAHGMRSLQGAYFLHTQGFEGVKSLTGGIVAWSRDGGAVVPPGRTGG